MLIRITFKHIAGVVIMLIGIAIQLMVAERMLGTLSVGFMAFFISIWLGGIVMALPDRKKKYRRKSAVTKLEWTSLNGRRMEK